MPAGSSVAGLDAQILDFAEQYRCAAETLASALPALASEDRGYIRPGEDEALRPPWAQWWRLHCAGLELLDELRQRLRACYHDQRRFLQAFTMALLLVERARALRSMCHERRLLRKKLNEAEPALGLPARCYDLVQRRLTKARHIARLMRARRRIDAAPELFAELAAAPESQALWECCVALQDAMQVSRRRLLLAHLRSKGRRIATRVGREGVGSGVYALQVWLGSVMGELQTRPNHRPSLPEAVRGRLPELLRPGDVLLTRKEHALSNHLLPGFWPHAILYIGAGEEVAGIAELLERGGAALGDCSAGPPYVLEGRKDGVRLRSLQDAYACDGLVLLRSTLPERALPQVFER